MRPDDIRKDGFINYIVQGLFETTTQQQQQKHPSRNRVMRETTRATHRVKLCFDTGARIYIYIYLDACARTFVCTYYKMCTDLMI